MEGHATKQKYTQALCLLRTPSPLIAVAYAGPRTYQDLLWDQINLEVE